MLCPMSNPLDVPFEDLRRLASGAGRQAGILARLAGILPAGLLKVKWFQSAGKKRRLSRSGRTGMYDTRISTRARIPRKSSGKRIG
jgi:hypothetical protein